MIKFPQGNLLDARTEAIVNTVNTVGIMGKGIALMFKEAFPGNFRAYREACQRKEVQVGHMFVTESLALGGPRWLINFPTKQHWRQPSKLEWIVEGLKDLQRWLRKSHPLHCAATAGMRKRRSGVERRAAGDRTRARPNDRR
jgi:O-acetyl-ADP-ribose deacetylase (regulator of RNase III)